MNSIIQVLTSFDSGWSRLVTLCTWPTRRSWESMSMNSILRPKESQSDYIRRAWERMKSWVQVETRRGPE